MGEMAIGGEPSGLADQSMRSASQIIRATGPISRDECRTEQSFGNRAMA